MINFEKINYLIVFSIFLLVVTAKSNWEPINSPTGGYVSNICSYQNDVFINSPGSGIYKMSNSENIWTRVSPTRHPLQFTSYLFNDENIIYAATNNGIFKSTNLGSSWVQIHSGINDNQQSIRVNKIKKFSEGIVFCTNRGLLTTYDAGNSWQNIPTSANGMHPNIIDFEEQINDYYLIDSLGNTYISKNKGTTWANYGFVDLSIYNIYKNNDDLIFTLIDPTNISGYNYVAVEKKSISDTVRIFHPEVFGDYLVQGYSKKQNNLAFSLAKVQNDTLFHKIVFSNDNGLSWVNTFDTTLLYSRISERSFRLYMSAGLTIVGNFIYAGTFNNGILRVNISTQNSNHFTHNIHNVEISDLAFSGNEFFAATIDKGIYYSGNSGQEWSQLKSSPKINPENYLQVNKITFSGESVIAATNNGLFKSNDRGQSWQVLGLSDYIVIELLVENNNIYGAGNLFSGNFFISSDNGVTWATRPVPDNSLVLGFLKDGLNFFVVTNKGIFRTSNQGTSWENVLTSTDFPDRTFQIVRSGNNLLAASSRGIFISNNNGFSWTKSDNQLRNSLIISLKSFGQYLFCSTVDGVFISMNHGIDWQNVSDGLGNLPVVGFSERQNDIYAILQGDAIHRTRLINLSKIRIENLSGDIYCNNMEFELSYKVESDIEFNSDNVFKVELSDENGNFSENPVEIGSVASTESGEIISKIPQNTNFGTGYRVRIVSTSPKYISIDNLFNIIILERSEPVISGENNVCAGDTVVYSTQYKQGFNYKWNITNGEIIGDDNSTSVRVLWNSPGSSSIKVLQQSVASCSDSSSVTILINPTPAKPVISEIDSLLYSSAENGNQWYFNGEIIPGAVEQFVKPLSDGYYTVRVTNEFGCQSLNAEPYLFERFEDRLVLRIDNSSAVDGEDVFLNLRLTKNRKYYELGVQNITANLVFDASILYPLSEEQGVIIDGKRYIRINIDTNYISNDIVKVMRFTAMLGSVESTSVTLENILINGAPNDAVRVLAGTFNLLEICYDGGPRLITSIPHSSIENLSPNPARDKISFSVKSYETSNADIYIINTLGNVEKILFSGSLSEGEHEFSYPLNNITIGNHYLILKTASNKVMKKFIITR